MTGNQLFSSALDICGLRKADGGFPTDIGDLTQRAPALINLLLAENSSLDARIRKEEHIVRSIQNLDQELEVTDAVAFFVLPYGLARLLMLGEDDEFALQMGAIYAEQQQKALAFGKAKIHSISEVYS